METAPPAGPRQQETDEQILHKLGYAQELFRGMGGFQNFAISFTIISILAGCLTSYFVGFERGGPVAVIWGWLLVGLFSTIIALAMAEIASAYPTAGGLYYWASKLGGPGWGWTTGWFNLIGQIAVTAAIGYGLATFGTVLFDYWFSYSAHMNDWFGASANMSIFVLYAIFLIAAGIINMFQVSVTALLNTISAYWHMAGVAFIVLVLIIVPDNHQSIGYVFGETVNVSGYGSAADNFSNPAFWFVFGLGLLLSQYTITGFDASAHMAEETRQASRQAAIGMYMAVVVSVVFGWILLLAVTFAIPSTEGALENIGVRRAVDLGGVDESDLGGGAALHLRRRAVLLRHRVRDLGVADDVRLLSRPGRPGTPALEQGRLEPRPAQRRLGDRRAGWHPDGPRDLELPRRLRRGHGDRRDRPLHRVRDPGLSALAAARPVRPGRVEPRQALQVDRCALAGLGRVDHDPLHLPALRSRAAVAGRLHLGSDNYTVLWFAGIGIVFGGWWFLSAKNWFKGPVRQGTEEELERREAELAGPRPAG